MENSVVHKILNIFDENREYYESNLREFHEDISPSFSPIEPEIKRLNLDYLKEEIAQNFATFEFKEFNNYYEGVIEIFHSNNFMAENNEYTPSDYYRYFRDRESFLVDYYNDNPNDILGEGEIEYIKICFNGFLYNYANFIESVIETIELTITNIRESLLNSPEIPIKPTVDFKSSLSTDENKMIIDEYISHLNGVNSKEEVILKPGEFQRLSLALLDLVENNHLEDKPFPLFINGITLDSIKYTLHKIHKRILTTKSINDNFITFIEKYFPDLSSGTNHKILKGTFHRKPKRFPF